MTDDEEYKDIKLICSLAKDIKIKGVQLFESRRETGTGYHTRMTIYKTSGGNYACSKVYETQWQDGEYKYLARICKNDAEVIEFFGLSDQAKWLYQSVEIFACIDEESFLKHGNPIHEDVNEFDEIEND